MSEVKQVKVDNWGIYFLQRLKHFFNRTDYCDLTLQFQDNAQLKVHRLVLSACTEYFELLERTCEMYEDCLVMPDDLQADVVVPIVNFMYTGQLEFKMDLLDKLHQTSEIMSMPVLTKLLDSHRPKVQKITHSYSAPKRTRKVLEATKETIKTITPTEIITTTPIIQTNKKRNFPTAFATTIYRDKKVYLPLNKKSYHERSERGPSPIPLDNRHLNKKVVPGDPRPTRYELPEELDTDNIFESSFCNISYTSQPLMVHPDTQKQYAKRPRLAGSPTSSTRLSLSTVGIVERKKPQQEGLFEESLPEEVEPDADIFPQPFENIKGESSKDTSLLFDQILEQNEEPTKFEIAKKRNKSVKTVQKPLSENLDHAKIISEVLKKYPHLVKSNKNIKLKIFNTPSKTNTKAKVSPMETFTHKNTKAAAPIIKTENEDYTYETDVIDSQQAARLIAMGAENVEGPWICLICGTPGKAMNFTSYYKFRRHLVEVHNEKQVLNMCEYCGQKSTKRNYLLHHLYTKHGIEPPPQFHFPKCNYCNYIALTEGLLIKHKASSHSENKNFRCNVCPAAFNSSKQLLIHIQNTGHKYSTEKKTNLQCIYCQKVFMREGNLCSHLKACHKSEAIRDSIIDDSDDDPDDEPDIEEITNPRQNVKSEPKDFEDIQYQIQKRPDGNIQIVTKKTQEQSPSGKQKILNSEYVSQNQPQRAKVVKTLQPQTEYVQDVNEIANNNGEIVVIDNNEYIIQDNQLIPRGIQPLTEEYILADQSIPSLTSESSMEYTNIHNPTIQESIQQPNVLLKNSGDLSQPIPIYVSNEAEYKALMASNPSIIVDNTDPNKMLTVLTAPHASSLKTTSIDLDNTQSSDMMIIQDNFPINVSEAVTRDNSNIVVVYSHQVGDDQNKQFQLLTSQGLGAQFVQSSAILTQNYETITTTTPVINAPAVGDKQEMWQNNIHQIINNNEIEITPVASIASIVDTNQSQIANPMETESRVDELPHDNLNSNNIEPNTITLSDTIIANESQDIIAEPNSDQFNYTNVEEQVCNTQTTPPMEIAEDIPLAEQPVDDISNINDPVENEPFTTQMEVSQSGMEEIQPAQQMESEESEETVPLQETTENANQSLIQPQDIVSSSALELGKIDDVSEPHLPNIGTGQDFVSADIGEKSQLETTPISEEDNTDQVDETQEGSHIPNNNPPTNVERCEELEESIENIQQEVDKQINATPSSVYEDAQTGTEPKSSQNETDDLSNTISSQEESDHEEPPETNKPDPVVATQKISSLLNDWDDSQEDNSGNDNIPADADSGEVEGNPSSEGDVVKNPLTEADETSEPLLENDKQDNIKSLVSDWDEDEEENKE